MGVTGPSARPQLHKASLFFVLLLPFLWCRSFCGPLALTTTGAGDARNAATEHHPLHLHQGMVSPASPLFRCSPLLFSLIFASLWSIVVLHFLGLVLYRPMCAVFVGSFCVLFFLPCSLSCGRLRFIPVGLLALFCTTILSVRISCVFVFMTCLELTKTDQS